MRRIKPEIQAEIERQQSEATRLITPAFERMMVRIGDRMGDLFTEGEYERLYRLTTDLHIYVKAMAVGQGCLEAIAGLARDSSDVKTRRHAYEHAFRSVK
jgi:hypothetical protein